MSDHSLNLNIRDLNPLFQPIAPAALPCSQLSHQLISVTQSPLMTQTLYPLTTWILPVTATPQTSLPQPPAFDTATLPMLISLSPVPALQLKPQPRKAKAPRMSDYAQSLQSKIESAPAGTLGQKIGESRLAWATRLKENFPDLTAHEAGEITHSHIWNLAQRTEFNDEPLSAMARQAKKELETTDQPQWKTRLRLAMELKEKYPSLTLGELVKLTHSNPGTLANMPHFRATRLSADGRKVGQLLESNVEILDKEARPHEKIRILRELAQQHSLMLNKTDMMLLADVSAPVISKYPHLTNKPLSAIGLYIKQKIDSDTPGAFARKEGQADYQWAADILKQQMQLSISDLVLLTGASYNTLGLMWRALRAPMSAGGKALQQRLASSEWNPYKQLPDESDLNWVQRVSNMDHRLTTYDLVQIKNCNAYSIKYRVAQRDKLSNNGKRVMATLHSSRPGNYAFRPGETWAAWFDRLQAEANLTDKDLTCITGLSPEIRAYYSLAPSAARPATLSNVASTSPAIVNALQARQSSQQTPPPRQFDENNYAATQPANLQMVDQFLRARRLVRVANDARTGSDYNNCLLIALLQHATLDYSQSPALSALVNNYRQLLVQDGWLGHENGFNEDGCMAFGQLGEHTQGAAAALLDIINANLVQGNLPPLRVVNYSFAAGMEFEEILGSMADNARVVHIVNTGQHFEALIKAPASPRMRSDYPPLNIG